MCGDCSRRDFLRTGALVAAGAAALPPALLAQHGPAAPAPADARAALQRLMEGNRRFAAGRSRHPHEEGDWRARLARAQHPFAIVIGCADSRVPPELLFDQGLGDIFTIRVAGQAIDDNVLGSVQYASLHLQTPLCVVLGHERCGAVTAAVEAKLGRSREPARIDALLKEVLPGLEQLRMDQPEEARLRDAVDANVRWALRQLMEAGAVGRLGDVGTALVGAVYDLDTGRVRLLA